jgi:hypothetical protein
MQPSEQYQSLITHTHGVQLELAKLKQDFDRAEITTPHSLDMAETYLADLDSALFNRFADALRIEIKAELRSDAVA